MRSFLWLLLLVGCAPVPGPKVPVPWGIRATRIEARNVDQFIVAVANTSKLGMDTIIIKAGGDFLHEAVVEAHRRGQEVWAEVGLREGERHPDWRAVDADHKPLSYLNPLLPEVRAHLVELARSASAAGVDGVRLELDCDEDSYDELTVARFGFIAGGAPDSKPLEWKRFWELSITGLLEDIRRAIPKTRLAISIAATSEGRTKLHQDVEGWIREGLVDVLIPTRFSSDPGNFNDQLKSVLEALGGGRVVAGGRPLVTREGSPVRAGGCSVLILPELEIHPTTSSDQMVRAIRAIRASEAAGIELSGYATLFGESGDEAKQRVEALRSALK